MTKSVILLNTTPPHKKYYIVELYVDNSSYTVTGVWGRLGARGRSKIWYQGPGHYSAGNAVQDLINTRLEHGYQIHQESSERAQDKVSEVEAFLFNL